LKVHVLVEMFGGLLQDVSVFRDKETGRRKYLEKIKEIGFKDEDDYLEAMKYQTWDEEEYYFIPDVEVI